jgi:hypothetical protein
VIISFYYCLTAQKNKQYFISGIFAGLAFVFRITSFFGLFTVFIIVVRRKLPASAAFIGGALTSCGLLIIALLLAGIDLSAVFHYMLTDNFGSGSTTDHSVAWKLDMFSANFFDSELVLFYPFVAGYILFRKKFDWFTCWLVCSFIGINVLGIYARQHFKELLPPLSLLSAFILAYAADTYKVSFKGLLILVWICFFPKILEPLWGFKKAVRHVASAPTYNPDTIQSDEETEKQLGLWIKNNTTETDKVFVSGYGARVQVFSERLSPTIYFNVTQTAEAKQRLYKDLLLNSPAMLVIPAFENYKNLVGDDIRNFIDQLAAQYYSFDKRMYGYNIYRLK